MPQIRSTKNQIILPKVPSFINFEGKWVAISSFSPEEIKNIGKRMTNEMLRKAKEQKFTNP